MFLKIHVTQQTSVQIGTSLFESNRQMSLLTASELSSDYCII